MKNNSNDPKKNTSFNNKPVHIKKYPLDGNREHAFTHLTCKTESNNPVDVNDRLPRPGVTDFSGST